MPMTKTVRGGIAGGQANEVQRPSDEQSNRTSFALDDFRSEVGAALERALRIHKAETIAAACDRKRSTIYRWAADPADVPLAALPALASFDPDPEFLARIAGLLLSIHAQRALAREAQGRAVMVFQELSPGRWGR